MANFFKEYTSKYSDKHKNDKISEVSVVGNKGVTHPKPYELKDGKNTTRKEREYLKEQEV